jgi:wyosine [tRNA(Phe)-imidazoG37] synthetase (radical SAM superfamily)
MVKYIFGPVPSARLGRSLGIDPVPLKTCNFSCVYCQLGRTRGLACDRAEFIDTNKIATEIRDAMTRHGPHDVDWVTFVGSGETTLHSGLGSLIETVKSMTDLPIAVITNGSLLYRPDVRHELSVADAVLPSLDAGTDLLYHRINRPHRDFSFKQHVEGLIEFRQVFNGTMWLEVMLVKGVNETTRALTAIAAAVERIDPDEVHITLPNRPPAEPWVEPPDNEGLARTMLILGSVARIVQPPEVAVTPRVEGNLIDAVHTIVACHPLREVELVRLLARWAPGRVFETLSNLADSGKTRVVERLGTRFWCAADTDYPEAEWDEDMRSDGGGLRNARRASPVSLQR